MGHHLRLTLLSEQVQRVMPGVRAGRNGLGSTGRGVSLVMGEAMLER